MGRIPKGWKELLKKVKHNDCKEFQRYIRGEVHCRIFGKIDLNICNKCDKYSKS